LSSKSFTKLTISGLYVTTETKTPVVLMLDIRGIGHSAAAVIKGFVRHKTDSFK
jgi:cobyrinic acid a,c-diamide synthase